MAYLADWLAKARAGRSCFTVVLTTRTLIPQWFEESQVCFKDGEKPRVFILENAKITALELINGDWDYMLATYEFVMAQYKRKLKYEQYLKFAMTNRDPMARKAYAKVNKLPSIPPLIVDEAHNLKNWRGVKHAAVKAMFYASPEMITGTPLHNTWTDVPGLLNLLPK
ncbi:hypothetical protein BT63DRAFT_459823 [Microthyrium microscopicum]|uniref:Helicase ATP-binding domain-containing protein n=1 Tax=Microthyrium microscopicum TaxID=703497 RepID=A0A6A6U0S2_9PEZI|nr:hypothetical protein BT63DRAFT_459823 [Microthyrium microscopicum]